MFTPHMTEEELQSAAYRDFLEIRMKVRIAFEQFIQRLRFMSGQRRTIHSLIEEKRVSTKSKNTWHVVLINTGYTLTGDFTAGCIIYMPLYRNNEVDYLFINNTDEFVLEKLSAHFLMRYKERYLEYNGIHLRGIHPALYYMMYNQDKTLTYYLPEKWTEKEMAEKGFMISKQGLSLVRFDNKLITYITFLDQANLSRYKAMVYEEETLWKDLECLNDPSISFEKQQALYMKHCTNPEKTKAVMRRYLQRTCNMEKMTEEQLEELVNKFDEVIEETLNIEKIMKQEAAEAEFPELPDVEYYVRQMKKGK